MGARGRPAYCRARLCPGGAVLVRAARVRFGAMSRESRRALVYDGSG
jgi:hypothetical protein